MNTAAIVIVVAGEDVSFGNDNSNLFRKYVVPLIWVVDDRFGQVQPTNFTPVDANCVV